MSESQSAVISGSVPIGADHLKVIIASSLGSVFEWFDFFLYGSLATIISHNFFSGVNETSAFIVALLAFGAGFAVRPLGAVVFGFFGDLWGRKKAFLVTLTLMGAGTFAVGLLPTYRQIGVAAPWILICLRMLQGLSIGGVYGGAATYVAEHVTDQRRGLYTSWIQITATGGMAMSLIVVFVTRTIVGEEGFNAWGWRIPFLLSSVLLLITIWIQRTLSESPVYQQMKASGRASPRPWSDALGNWRNLRLIMIALFGAMVGQAVIWYTAQFYVLFFLERVLRVDGPLTNLLMALALILSTPLYVMFGWLSDKIGRRPVILGACLLSTLTLFPLFKALTAEANPELSRAILTAPISVLADPRECSFQFDPIGRATFASSCDIVRSYLTRSGVSYKTLTAPMGSLAVLQVGSERLAAFSGEHISPLELAKKRAIWESQANKLIAAAGYPAFASRSKLSVPGVVMILITLMSLSAMVYGPMAAFLVELFPSRVRYTSVSIPYHLGTGWFGGFLPTVAFAIVAATGDIYSGLWYPLVLAGLTFVIGCVCMPETKDADILA